MIKSPAHPSVSWLVSKRVDLSVLAAITIFAALLRATGIPHGMGYHPDERHMLMVTDSLSRNGMNPRSFAYGSFSFYAAWLFSQMVAPLRPIWNLAGTYDGLFYTSRILCTLLGTATVALSYYLGVLLYRRSVVGLIAAFLLACNVFHLQLSRYFTSDIPLTLLCVISMIALIKAQQRGTLGAFLLFGVCAGLATATKIASVFLAAPLMVVIALALIREWPSSHSTERALKIIGIVVGGFALLGITLFLTYWKGYPKILKYRVAQQAFLIPLSVPFLAGMSVLLRKHSLALSKLFACFAVGTLVFVLAEPFAILDFETFTRHTREQTSMVRGYWRPPYTIQYEGTVPYFYHLKQMLWYTMGWPIFALVVVGFLATGVRVLFDLLDKVFRRELATRTLTPEMIPLIFVAVFFMATGYFQVKFPRYLLPLYPMLFVFVGALFAKSITWPSVGSRSTRASSPTQRLVRSSSLVAPVEVSISPLFEEAPASVQQTEEKESSEPSGE